jgi:ribonuclease D
MSVSVEHHRGDLPADIDFGKSIAIDTETLGLNPLRDRLCLIQMSAGDGSSHLVQFEAGQYDAPNLKKILADESILKIFHFARFDIAVIKQYLGITCRPVYCTKIASKLTRTYTDRHGLKDICAELLDVDISKQQQQSDWGANELSPQQLEYAASDVLYLHRLKEVLDRRLLRENRMDLANACFGFLPHRAELDLTGWADQDIFAHS